MELTTIFFKYNALEPRPSATDDRTFAALKDHARLVYLPSEQVPGVHDPRGFTRVGKLQSPSFPWNINEFSPKSVLRNREGNKIRTHIMQRWNGKSNRHR